MNIEKFAPTAPYKGLKIFGYVLLGVIAAAFFALVFGYFVMMLWNWLMPELFGLATINYWQAFGIIILARLIFGGFKHEGHRHDKSYKNGHWPPSKWKSHFHKNWKYYDQWWKEKGEKEYDQFVARQKQENPKPDIEE